MQRSVLQRDPSQFGEFRNARRAAETAVTGGLHPAEWNLRLIVNGGSVDVANAAFDASG